MHKQANSSKQTNIIILEQIRKIKDFSLICSRPTKVFDCKEKIWWASDYSIYIIGKYNFPIIWKNKKTREKEKI